MSWLFKSAKADDLALEALTLDHARAIADIHAETFTPAWTDGEFQDLLSNKTTSGFCLRLPYDQKGTIVGFALVRVVADEAEILTISVFPKWQHKGVGRRLLDAVLAELRRDGIASLFLEVDATNQPAINLYKRIGFEEVAKRENYYNHDDGKKTHALVMRYNVG